MMTTDLKRRHLSRRDRIWALIQDGPPFLRSSEFKRGYRCSQQWVALLIAADYTDEEIIAAATEHQKPDVPPPATDYECGWADFINRVVRA